MTDQPLSPGEYVDLDGGVRVNRGRPDQWRKEYLLRDEVADTTAMLDRNEIRELAELAGYEVRDP